MSVSTGQLRKALRSFSFGLVFWAAVIMATPTLAAPPILRELGGIKLGATGSEVTALMGEPAETSSDFELPQEVAPAGGITYMVCDSARLVLLVGKIAPMHARVVQVTINGDPCPEAAKFSVQGIGLGATEKEILAKFGEPDRSIERTDSPLKTIAYNVSNVAFTLDGGVLKSLSIVYRNQMMVEDLTSGGKMTETEAWKAIGDMRLRGRQFDLAREAFEKVVQAEPKSVDALVKLGGAYFALDKRDKAAQSYRSALALDPNNALATYNLGRIALRENRLDDARKLLTRASQLDPRNPAVHNELGLLEEQENKLDAAEKSYRRAAELAPDSSQPHQNLGRLLVRKGDRQGAIEAYRRAVVLELQSPAPNREVVAALRKAIETLSAEDASRRAPGS